MQIDNRHLSTILSENRLSEYASGLIGIEKENLRVSNAQISRNEYESSLGSSLCNKYITTDFSESQFEFITPPIEDASVCLKFLDDTHHFTQTKIGEDLLWPFSMPPFVKRDDDIPIAKYGQSNPGLFRTIYRNGLSYRYGRLMQTISGLHYNFSFPDIFFRDLSAKLPNYNERQVRSDIYLRTIRNIHRINWLLLYLFGSSPIVSKSFTKELSDDFLSYKDSFYLPHATSLRMSDLGYNNSNRADLFISTNNIDEYANDLLEATNTNSKIFANFPNFESGNRTQINTNILQIEDEYYAIARPKSSIGVNTRLASKLKTGGVNYIELRSIDLDPFTRIGIRLEDIIFLKVIIIYCAFAPSPKMTKKEHYEIKDNDLIVAKMGRKQNLFIKKASKKISLDDWAFEIFDELYLINEKIGNDNCIIDKFRKRLVSKEETLSAKLLDTFLSSSNTLDEIGIEIAQKNKEDFLKEYSSKKPNFKTLENEALRSIKEQENLERYNDISFDEFLDNYFEK